MDSSQLRGVVRHLHRLAAENEHADADAQLLQRFVTARDEMAFELLLRRHGPMVRGVCRRLLRRTHDVEDAFQATFLALVRKAGGITGRGSLSGWLYRVAYRTALRARSAAGRLPATGDSLTEPVAPPVSADLVWRDLRPLLDDEVSRLPARYSLPVVLCYFQGMSHEEAARELGCAKTTVAVRLLRARKLLHGRLTRRGLALSAGALVEALSQHAARATLPAATVHAALRAAVAFGTGSTAGASTRAVSLAEGVLRTMLLTKVKATAAVILLTAGLVAFGVGWLPRSANVKGAPPAPDEPPPAKAPTPPPERPADVVDISAERDGRLVLLGTEIKDGDKVQAEDVVTTMIDGKVCRFRRLNVGDRVEDGQFIGQIDDELARIEVARAKAKVRAAEADRVAAEKTRDEARARLNALDELRLKTPGSVSPEEYRGAELTQVRFAQEEIAKAAQVRAAELDVAAAEKLLALHQIRAVRGEIKAILIRPGQSVKAGDTVVRIRVDGRPARVPAEPKDPDQPKDKGTDRPSEQAPPARLPADVVNAPARVDGFLTVLGTEIKDGDKVPEAEVIVIKSDAKERRFRRLKDGDKVQEGQLIGVLDDRLARIEVEASKAKLQVAEAEQVAAARSREEAETTYALLLKNEGAVAAAEIRAAQTKRALAKQDEVVAAARVRVAATDVQKAEYLLSLHEIRAVRGEIKAILVRPGNLVKAGDAVVQIRVEPRP
jgi:RNA polymerase sigma factor (sigma-70 family)